MNGLFKKIFLTSSNNLTIQFFRYVIVGGTAAFVDISLYNILAIVLQINHIAANTVSFLFGLVINYYMSREWVFNKKQHDFKKDFFLFAIIGVIGMLLSNFILYILIDCKLLISMFEFLSQNMAKSLAKPIAVVIVLFWNFAARKVLVFRN